MASIPDDSDPRVLRYVEFYRQRTAGQQSAAEIARELGFETPEALYWRLGQDGFPVCEECGETPTPPSHCGNAFQIPPELQPSEEARSILDAGLGSELPIPALAQLWLRELMFSTLSSFPAAQAGGFPTKQVFKRSDEGELATYPMVLESGQRLWLQIGGIRRAAVLEEPRLTDVAVLATLAVLETGQQPLDEDSVERFKRALRQLEPPLKSSGIEYIHELAGEHFQLEREAWAEEDPKRRWELESEARKRIHLLQDLQPPLLGFILQMLRYIRPDFDGLPHTQQIRMIEGYGERIADLVRAVNKLVAYGEYGVPGRDLRKTRENAERDIQAAVLSEVEGLNAREIGKRLGFGPPSASARVKGSHPTVSAAAKRGRELLIRALGEEGWRREAEAMKTSLQAEQAEREAEIARWEGYTAEDKQAWELAEHSGATFEETAVYLSLPEEQRRLWDLYSMLADGDYDGARQHIRSKLS